MAINFAQKYASTIDERFKLGAVTAPAVNMDYDFTGVKTVKVYSIPTVELSDYQRSGSARYGTPTELQDSVQEMTVSCDRSFTFTIDRGNDNDQMGAKNAGLALQRELDEVVIPEIDIYRLKTMCTGAGKESAVTAITKSNAYDAFLTGTAYLAENKVNASGLVAYISPEYYKCIKQDASFVRNSEMGQEMLVKGQIGYVDGIRLIMVPSSYLPKGISFVLAHPVATCAPVKLSEYKIHDNPPGINGYLVEGRVNYDAFVLNNKKNAIYVHRSAAKE